ncbi:putative lipoprotein [Leptospira borgpetersenii str. 200701203]|uniref:Putative lipoprotein n=1 Tax=Leptospira borgpetersenii str. 200701203 TaxID=1193007 RepID=M3HSC3_LEPBO|nr:putative lipoprotein [Leptospira borgpetersenii str. 200701203]
MKMKKIIWISFCSILLSCKGSIDLEKFASAQTAERKGTPALFYLNESEFSAKNFRKEFFSKENILPGNSNQLRPRK